MLLVIWNEQLFFFLHSWMRNYQHIVCVFLCINKMWIQCWFKVRVVSWRIYVHAVAKNIHWIHHSLMPRGNLMGKTIVNKVVITFREQDTISTSAVSRSLGYDIRPENQQGPRGFAKLRGSEDMYLLKWFTFYSCREGFLQCWQQNQHCSVTREHCKKN